MSNHHKKANGLGGLWYLIIGAAIFAVIVGVGLYGSPSDKAGGAPVSKAGIGLELLSAEESFFDFGSISMSKGRVAKKFIVKNDSDDEVTVRKVYTSCMCTTAYLEVGNKRRGPFGMPGHGGALTTTYQKIASGEAAEVEVVFDPAAHGPAGVGKISRVVTIETEEGVPVELSFEANVTP